MNEQDANQVRTTDDVRDQEDVAMPDSHPDQAVAGEQEDDLQAEIENLRAEKQAAFEKLARVQADYQNAQRRLEKDMDQRLRIAAGQLIRALLWRLKTACCRTTT